MIIAIIIDLDGTTLPRNWHQISEETGLPWKRRDNEAWFAS